MSQLNEPSILIIVRGIPGSGKSYLSERLHDTIGHKKSVLLDPDTLDTTSTDFQEFSKQLSREGLDSAIHPFRWLRYQACQHARPGYVTIWNQPFTQKGIFDRLVTFIQAEADKNNVKVKVLVVEVIAPKEIAYSRIVARIKSGGHGPSENTFAKRVEDFISFSDSYETLQLDGTIHVNELEQAVLEKLQDIL